MLEYVTGANGFIGSHLQKRISGVSIPHNAIDGNELGPYSRFFFLSAYGNMAHHTEDAKILQANISDLVSVIRQTDFTKIDSFCYMSSSSVKLPVQTMYSRTKRAAEEILLSFMEKYNSPILIIRPYSVTGVGEQSEHLIPKLIHSAMTGEHMNFVPEPTHDFIDVEDLVDGIMLLSERRAKGIFELGNGQAYSNAEVLRLVEKVTGKKANITTVRNMRAYDTNNWVATNVKAKNMGWLPKKSLEQSIKEMVDVYPK